MIRSILSLTLIIIIFTQSLTVHADVVMGNEFLYKNEDKVEYISGRRFIVNTPEGYIIPRDEPGSDKGISTRSGYRSSWGSPDKDVKKLENDVFVFLNNEIIYIEAIYYNKSEWWGIMQHSHVFSPPGWFPMSELLLIYEREDFEIENQDYIYEYTGDYNAITSAKEIVFWQWPGSDREKTVVDCKREEFELKSVTAHHAYDDSQGRTWAYIEIRYSYREYPSPYTDNRPYYIDRYDEGWICSSEPENENIPSFYPAPNPQKWLYEGLYDWSVSDVEIYPPAKVSDIPEIETANIEERNNNMMIALLFIAVTAVAVIPTVINRRKK